MSADNYAFILRHLTDLIYIWNINEINMKINHENKFRNRININIFIEWRTGVEQLSLRKLANVIINKQTYFSFKTENFQAVLTSTHNLCFGAKIRKTSIPLHTPFSLYTIGV